MCYPILVDIFTMHHEEYGRRIRKHGEASLGNLFALTFLHK